jgi:Domain of unknown function (DUF4175)
MRREAIVRGLRSLWPPLMVLAGVGALGLLTRELPGALISVIAGAALAIAAWLFYRGVADFDPIDEDEAKHRIERQAGLSEMAPLTSSADRLVGGDGALWSWHRRRLEAMAGALSKPAKPDVTRQDALKLVALLLALGVCFWQPVPAARALNFDLSPLLGDNDLVMDAWAQPPEYTGLPVVRLSRETPNVSLPEGSIISARMDGAKGAPRLRVGGQTIVMTRERGQAWTGKATLKQSGTVILDRLGARATWHVTAIKDKAPVLISEETIKIDPKGRLDVSFAATDDYGIASAFVRVTARKAPVGLVGNNNFETPLILEGEPGEDGARRIFVDVADHALTGLEADVTLVVRDGLGQETFSKPTRLTMPKVDWKTPLGAALQEQRLSILREARPYQQRPPAFATLFDSEAGLPIKLDLDEPLLGAPEGISVAFGLLDASLASLKQVGLSEVGLMGLQFARERLAMARTVADAHAVAPLLWDMAMQAEVADQSPAQQKIAAARQALEQALKNGASEEELSQLTQELREAVGERLDELAQQGDGQGNSQGGGGGDSVSNDEIDSMLRELERSGGSGARQDALDQLDKLGELMENLQPGGAGAGEAGESGQGQSVGPLDDAMREQRDLSDETNARKGQNQGAPAGDLADRQEDLADRLSPPGGGARPQQGPEAQGPDGQVQAGKAQAAQAMREAAQALRRGDLGGASEAQARAEQALQQAAGAQNANGGEGGDQDPLGRSMPNNGNGADEGKGTKVPDQVERRRARDVREELRRRQADPNRDDQERNYLDRLLKDR